MDIAATARSEFVLLKSLLGATVMTMGLLYFMHLLISAGDVELENESTPIADVIAMPKIIETIKEEIPKPKRVQEPTEMPPVMQREQPDVTETNHSYGSDMGYSGGHIIKDSGIGISAGGLVQQVMVPPVYPQRALVKGIEGFVDVQFEVTEIGSTDQVRVVFANPEGVFDRAAIRAVKRWKYLPNEDRKGNPATLTERIRFAIQD